MANKLVLSFIIVIFIHSSAQDVKKQSVENDINMYAELASSFLKDQNAESIGGMISNMVQSDGGKQLGDMLMNIGGNNNGNDILQSIGSLISQGSGSSGGFDPTILFNVLGALNSGDISNKKEDGHDSADIFSMLSGIVGQDGGGLNNIMTFLPMILNTVNSFREQGAQKRTEDHSGHAWFLPPILEKLHVAFDLFMNSELGRSVMKNIGTEKFIKAFADKEGKFSFPKFLELLENHSFRKHWIELVTRKIAGTVSYFGDPKTQKRFLTTVQYFINSVLKAQGFPKTAMFDPSRATETLSSLINHFFKKYFSYKVSAKQYVKPAVEYVQDIFQLAQKKGFFTGRGIDSSELSHKLADTINLEIIEPVARVYRAYRFAKKNPQCDRYVLCLVNEEQPNEVLSLPGLKGILSKSSSLFASWFLSGYTGTSFWSLYSIVNEGHNCETQFVDTCNDFHIEEIKVTTEYVHNEL